MKLTYLHHHYLLLNCSDVCLLTGCLLAVLVFAGSAKAQSSKRNSNWYFGEGAGLTFNGGAPQALTNGKVHTREGCAARSGPNGQLLFYTDGRTIWNRNHDVMAGATNLGGSSQSSQSALIVPYQNSDALFYVFSVAGQNEPGGIQYAQVDMNLNGGLGGLTFKNRQLLAPAAEKITTIPHCNNLNHWIIAHDAATNAFVVYLLNDNGLILPAKVYTVGSNHQSVYGSGHPHLQKKGYMKPSHDGRKLAVAVSDSVAGGFLELFDFDNKTGAVSNPVKLETAETVGAYGIEFSPDNSLIYLSTLFSKKIYQIRVSDLTITATITAQSLSGSSPGIGALQTGIDNKVYGTQPGGSYLMAINQPDQPGTGCGLVSQAVNLGGIKAMAGLPFNVDTLPYLPPKVNIALTKLSGCNNYVLSSKTENLDPAYLVYQWYRNGVAVTGATSSSLTVSKSGTYLMKVRETKCLDIQIASDEELPVVLVEANPTASAIPDSCGAFLLNAHATGGIPLWTGMGISLSQNQQDSLIVSGVNGRQTFQVRVTNPDNENCFVEAEVSVTFTRPDPFLFASSTRTACGDTLTLRATPTADWDSFRWQQPNGSRAVGSVLIARQSGPYSITAISTATGCRSETAIRVTLNPNPEVLLANKQIDTCLALGDYLKIDPGTVVDADYSWLKNGNIISTNQVLEAQAYGTYRVVVRTAAGCQTSDSLRINANCPPRLPVAYVPDVFTPNQDGINETLVIYSSSAKQMILSIYNRWGELLYTGTGDESASAGWSTWDGTYKGQRVNSGLYVYRLVMQSRDYPNEFVQKGVIEVAR
ncbi:gliding motility-associated C-terminal domain-containing protein [Spirosoma sp. SC4-14]|uniref:T9SS type B sorting domain-containing protein n=1 Tax=Spirosoma sp. SC4-14 TaxID=3128900 RepID=UPI0030D4C191